MQCRGLRGTCDRVALDLTYVNHYLDLYVVVFTYCAGIVSDCHCDSSYDTLGVFVYYRGTNYYCLSFLRRRCVQWEYFARSEMAISPGTKYKQTTTQPCVVLNLTQRPLQSTA